jgi:carbon dioxide concentrating mechanism protein CcmN
MYLPPLQPNRNPDIYISGDVIIDEDAAIASGVILQAAPGTHIMIAAGVCIGMGSILQACQGNLIIEEGATLGAGVLAIGTGKIGANACIGSATTLLHPVVASNQVIAPGSILGDESREWVDVETTSPDPSPASSTPPGSVTPEPPAQEPPPPPDPTLESDPENQDPWKPYSYPDTQSAVTPPLDPENQDPWKPYSYNGVEPAPAAPPPPPPEETAIAPTPGVVYGQKHLNQLMRALFPHKQTPIQPTPED